MASERNHSPNSFTIHSDDSNSRGSMHENASQQDLFEEEENSKVKQSNKKDKAKPQQRFVPGVAVQEKIAIFIDNSCDKGLGYTFSEEQDPINPSSIRNEAIRVYITNKLAIAKETQFVLVSIDFKKAKWMQMKPTSSEHLTKILSEMKSLGLQSTSEEVSDYDITPLFENVLSLFGVPDQPNSKALPPNYLVRVILVYNNSMVVPKVNISDKSFIKFLKSPYCVLDVLYLHEEKSDFNNVEEIFQELSKLVCHRSYLLECSRDITNVFNSFAKLLAHPYQRVNQHLWEF